MFRKVSLLLVAVSSVAAAAQTAPKVAVPRGPIKVTSQRAEIDQQGRMMLYRGKVRLTSGELELRGERLELREPATGRFEARISGKPARVTQAAQGGAPPLVASAQQIVYDTAAATLSLSGAAQLERGNDVLTGERISYDLESRRISASGADGEQIRFVIHPPEDPPEDPSEAPAPEAPPPAQPQSPPAEGPSENESPLPRDGGEG